MNKKLNCWIFCKHYADPRNYVKVCLYRMRLRTWLGDVGLNKTN